MLELVNREFPALAESVQVMPIAVNADRTEVQFVGSDPAAVIPGQSVLLFDGAVHSGSMMQACAAVVLSYRPAEMISYTLVIKNGSGFIPTLWGVMIAETDRAFFLLDAIPNQRLEAGSTSRPSAPVHLEQLGERHLTLPPVVVHVGSMDRVRWSERHFQMQASEGATRTYVLMRGAGIVGYLTLHGLEGGGLMVDEIAVDADQQGKGYGGVLMRFADTLARQTSCRFVRLFGIEAQVPFYEGLKYRKLTERAPVRLDAETYWPMERTVLYHQAPVR